MKKRCRPVVRRRQQFKKQSDLIKHAVANIPLLTAEEQLCRNVLRLGGIRNPSPEFIRCVIKEQQTKVVKQRYKELTDG